MELQNELKEYVLRFKSLNREPARQPMLLTKKSADKVNKKLSDHNEKYIETYDQDGNLKEVIDKYEVKGIKRLDKKEIDKLEKERDVERRLICEYGGRHKHLGSRGFEECECREIFNGMPWFTFENILRDKYGINYSEDITKEMRAEMREFSKTWDPKASYTPKYRGKAKDGFEQVGAILTDVVKNKYPNIHEKLKS